MVTLYYRGMAEKQGKPRVGRSARLLGIRPGVDVDVALVPEGWLDNQGYLRPEGEHQNFGCQVEVVLRNAKGMSVSLSIAGLPAFRKPTEFGGTGRDPLWQIDSTHIAGDLEAVQDSATHVSIVPRVTMLLERYEMALAKTQDYWRKVEQDGMDI